jgi:hypothetical protein
VAVIMEKTEVRHNQVYRLATRHRHHPFSKSDSQATAAAATQTLESRYHPRRHAHELTPEGAAFWGVHAARAPRRIEFRGLIFDPPDCRIQ